ncbi:MAG: ABC transporter ATP-binding protein [Fusobacterium perfoetens]|uniref:ABC transporter ATP-binding protein n=1 Tax=Fusobacterium perfoetens TaxID=852 RepID=UPI002A748346|nr:ABC transporter ATP-binding protein [Fusobacterium perfoetens]MDY3237536.1 ABC transporter ATP-binding protein [Fusobacterium perfoetens]
MIERFLSYYKPFKKIFILDMLASFLIACLGMLYPITTRVMLNNLIPNKNYKMIYIFGFILLVTYVIRMLLRYFVQYYGHIMGVKMQAQMRSEMFKKIQKLPYSYYDNHETGKIMSRMTNDLMDISELAHHAPENFFIFGIMIVGSFIYLLTIEKTLTLIIFTCVPVMIIVSATFKNRMRDAFMESRKSIAVINASLESSISGIRVTKAFNNSEIEQEKFEIGNSEFVEARRKAYKAMGQFFSSTTFITDFFNVIVLIAGGIFLFQNKITSGDYATFIISVNLFITPLTKLIDFTEQYQNGITGFKRFLEIMDETPEKNPENPIELKNVVGNIEFKNVSFSYNDSKQILKNLSFSIPAGKKIALVGPSGEGKTTICHLIPNFYKINSGEITVDGIDINKISLESLRSHVGIVQQDVYLFGGTIKENILYGNPKATDEEIYEAAKKSNIHDYIMSLEKGYDTEIGERGVKLSGGQKQRLSIARVFLKNPAILILDEATSALDNTTEIFIQKELEELSKGRTTLVVAHRLSTIKNADEIFVILNGNIQERGNHQELLAKKGIYFDLYFSMFNK